LTVEYLIVLFVEVQGMGVQLAAVQEKAVDERARQRFGGVVGD
jgi:hypothetical protein